MKTIVILIISLIILSCGGVSVNNENKIDSKINKWVSESKKPIIVYKKNNLSNITYTLVDRDGKIMIVEYVNFILPDTIK